MISTFLVEYAWAVPLAYLAVLAACVLVGTLLLRTRNAGHRATLWLAMAAALTVLLMTLLPEGGTSQVTCTVRFAWPALGAVETLANTALLLPAVYFLTLHSRRPVAVVLAASLFSALIETAQALTPTIGRACDTTDWEMNTIGAIIGGGLAWLTYTLTRGTDPPDD